MSEAKRYKILSPQIIHETIGGEVVVVNLETGTYYSIEKVGAIVWSCIDHGCTIDSLVSHVAALCEGDPANIERGIQEFIDKLEKEKLILCVDSEAAGPADDHSHTVYPEKKIPFDIPKLNVYTDMQDLLLLDPIHDVDESGWPSKGEKDKQKKK